MEETWTILKVLQWTTGYFSRKGIDQPRANAEVLLAHVLGTDRIQLYLHFDRPLSAAELASYRELVRRRADREPTQYITQKQEFWSLEFEVNPFVLIPRPETELLLEKALELMGDFSGKRILDLATGSGAIAVSLAHERSAARIIATDKSCEALQVAKRNAVRHHVQDRVHLAAMDLFSGFSPARTSFDLILSNPPYIGEVEFATLAPEVVCHEPQAALRGGGAQGLDTILRILREVPPFMKPGSMLLMEIGHDQAKLLDEEFKGSPWIEGYEFIKDYSGFMRVLHLRKTNQ